MATCTPIYLSSAEFYAPRPFIHDLEIRDPGVTDAVLSDDTLLYVFGLYTIIVKFNPFMVDFTHRHYNVQSVLDIANCRAILGGVDQDFGLYFWINAEPTRKWLRWRFKVQPLEDDGVILVLPAAPPDYWVPDIQSNAI